MYRHSLEDKAADLRKRARVVRSLEGDAHKLAREGHGDLEHGRRSWSRVRERERRLRSPWPALLGPKNASQLRGQRPKSASRRKSSDDTGIDSFRLSTTLAADAAASTCVNTPTSVNGAPGYQSVNSN
jgi:hypothetical protein